MRRLLARSTNLISRKPMETSKNAKPSSGSSNEGCPLYQEDIERAAIADIQQHASKGCEKCMLLREVASSHPVGIKEFTTSGIRKWATWKSVYAYTHKNSQDVELFVMEGQPKLFPELHSKARFGDTSSDDSFSRAQEWLSRCCSSHILCKQKLGAPLPRRVIDVSGGSVRLVETQNQIDRYISLSHCWGQSRPPCLTTLSNLKKNLCAIEWESIPNTFKHAIQVTRKLGVQFLWIDSICIIQDDNRDWEEESSKMASIYQNSYLTLCATWAPSDDAGLWPSLPVSTLHKVTIQKRRKNYEVWFREADVVHAVHLRVMHMIPVWEHTKALSPIATRSWTFQEQILSPRLLHFGNGELLWECMEGSTCECSTTREFESSDYRRHNKAQIYKVLSSKDPKEIATLWRYLVEQYSRLSMTLPKDVFPALSGIAKIFQDVRPKDEYLAGLWKSTILEDLVWNVCWNLPRHKRPEKWRAPSWSWASVCSTVMFNPAHEANDGRRIYYPRLSRASTALSYDSTGEITSGSIVLRGPAKMTKVISLSGRLWFVVEANSYSIHCTADSLSELENGKLRVGDDILCLRLCSKYSSEDFLLLLKPIDGRPGVYERLGLADGYREQLKNYWFKNGADLEVEII